LADAIAHWQTLVSDPSARFDRVVDIDASAIRPQVSWGTSPEMVAAVDGRVPDPAQEHDPARRGAIEAALRYMDLAPGRQVASIAIDKVFIGSCTNSRIEDLRMAAAVVQRMGRRIAGNVRLAMVVPGSGLVKAQAELEGLDRLFDVSGDERRQAGAGRTLRIDLEPQLRRAPGGGRAQPPGQSSDGGGSGHRRPVRGRGSRYG
jgi:3-isopropylmalate/(R)-2-methylmalate dehydratase large subunit